MLEIFLCLNFAEAMHYAHHLIHNKGNVKSLKRVKLLNWVEYFRVVFIKRCIPWKLYRTLMLPFTQSPYLDPLKNFIDFAWS